MPVMTRFATRTALAAAAIASCAAMTPAWASSHREAPFITTSPKVDGTDFYMFNSYEANRTGFVTLIANYLPLQDAYGGPNYFALDPNALYEIHIDNNGDGVEDVTFQFRFKNTLKNNGAGQTVGGIAIPLRAIGPVAGSSGATTANLSFDETYEVTAVFGPRRSDASRRVQVKSGNTTTFTKPIDYVGTKTLGDQASYESYAGQYVYPISFTAPNGTACTGKVFVGQRKEAFSVNLGRIFDLVNAQAGDIVTEQNAYAFNGGSDAFEFGELTDKNVTSLAIEVNKGCLTAGSDPVIGGWTSASLRQARLLNGKPASGLQANDNAGGAWVQVSRLGMPLVNEVVIGLKDKDKFNASKPANDASNFAPYVLTPTLPGLLNALFGLAVPSTPRNDIATIFLTGIPTLNKSANASPALAEMLRLNTTTTGMLAPRPVSMQNPLGVLGVAYPTASDTPSPNPGVDYSGFPNGRRPIDDVVDISLRVVTGKLCGFNSTMACGNQTTDPNAGVDLVDGVRARNASFPNTFPYLNTPIPGAR